MWGGIPRLKWYGKNTIHVMGAPPDGLPRQFFKCCTTTKRSWQGVAGSIENTQRTDLCIAHNTSLWG